MRGSIRKYGKHWTVVVSVGRDPVTRKRKQQWEGGFKTKADAQAYAASIVNRVQGGGYVAPTKVTTGQFLEDWLSARAGGVEPTTLRIYRRSIRAITQRLGWVLLAQLNPIAIQRFFTDELAAGTSHATVRSHRKVLSTALGHAVEWELIGRNPAKNAKPPKAEPRERPVWDEEQVRLFLARAKRESAHYPLYLTALLTGMREGELLGLRWQDVDLALDQAHVRQTFYRLSGSKREGSRVALLFRGPKTKTSVRTVALPQAVVASLREIREVQAEQREKLGAEYQDRDLVFCQPNGKPLHIHNVVRRDMRPLTERAGVPRIRFHDIRHCHVSYLARAGVPVKVAQERVGHASSKMTLDVYSHTLPGMHEDAARRVEALLLGTNAMRKQSRSEQSQRTD